MLNIDQTYIICSEEHEKDRYISWNNWIENNKIQGQTFFYKWGADLSPEDLKLYIDKDGTLERLYHWRTGYPIRPAEASIGINFIKIFADAKANNYENILILESDVLLHPDFIDKVNIILQTVENTDYNCISLGCGMGLRLQNQNNYYLAYVDQFRCADSLIFNRTAINHFYHNLKQIRLPIDEEFTNAVREKKTSVLWLEPPIAIQKSQITGNTSSIQFSNPYNLEIPW